MTRPLILDLHPRGLRLTDQGRAAVGEAVRRYRARAWWGRGYIRVERVPIEHRAALRDELEAIAARDVVPARLIAR